MVNAHDVNKLTAGPLHVGTQLGPALGIVGMFGQVLKLRKDRRFHSM